MEIGATLSTIRNVAWAVAMLLKFTRFDEPPIFGVEWRFYDSEPGSGNAVGHAIIERAWCRRRVQMRYVRIKERSDQQDTRRVYVARGVLHDRKLVLTWRAEDRPDTFGSMVLSIDEGCTKMKGYTIFVPQDPGVVEAKPMWFKKARQATN